MEERFTPGMSTEAGAGGFRPARVELFVPLRGAFEILDP